MRGATSSCNKFEEFGLLYFYKELVVEERKAFEHHLAGCAFCRHALKELAGIVELYDSLPEEEPSSDVVKNILERAKRKEQKEKIKAGFVWLNIFQKWGSPHRQLPRPVTALVGSGIGVVLILVAIGYFFSQKPKPYLDWDYKMDDKIELIEAGICDLREGMGILNVLGVKEMIEGVKEDINSLEKGAKTW